MTFDRAPGGAVRVTLGARHSDLGVPPLVVDPSAADGRIRRSGRDRATLQDPNAAPDRPEVVRIVLGEPSPAQDGGVVEREIVVDGWAIIVRVEPERRAALRERATKARAATTHAGATEVRAVIPGRVVEVGVMAGDGVEAGGRLLLVEAMKMQNEVRTPRGGRVARVEVAAGQTVELGDLLVVIE